MLYYAWLSQGFEIGICNILNTVALNENELLHLFDTFFLCFNNKYTIDTILIETRGPEAYFLFSQGIQILPNQISLDCTSGISDPGLIVIYGLLEWYMHIFILM